MAGLDDPVGAEPPDVFCGLGCLIVEGRVKRSDGRGYGEGPHAPANPGVVQPLRHVCSVENVMCKKDENFRKHMLLLWQNNVPVSIEVLLCSDCRIGQQKADSVEYTTIPEPGSILLEQWTVSISNSRGAKGEKLIGHRGLFQAVRSYLHFSQLSAWYSSTKGANPKNVLFRITIPGEAFASKFLLEPQVHIFPPAAVGRTSSVNVVVRSYPRTTEIPRVACCHNQVVASTVSSSSASSPSVSSPSSSAASAASFAPPSSSSSSSSSSNTPTASQGVCGVTAEQAPLPQVNSQVGVVGFGGGGGASNDEEAKMPLAGALSWREMGTDLRKTLVKNRLVECTSGGSQLLSRSDSMDSMLGDSLLDPPQCLQRMPPKRYQSPSRCGSPCLEAPDHLLMGHHYKDQGNNSKNNNTNLAAVVGGAEASDLHSESSRCTRQDLLRRRDLNLFHGLHPRILHLGGHQPRLSLPAAASKAAGFGATAALSVVPDGVCRGQELPGSRRGPYRAFPPERPFPQILFSSPVQVHPSQGSAAASASSLPPPYPLSTPAAGGLDPNADPFQRKCSMPGKHMCSTSAASSGNPVLGGGGETYSGVERHAELGAFLPEFRSPIPGAARGQQRSTRGQSQGSNDGLSTFSSTGGDSTNDAAGPMGDVHLEDNNDDKFDEDEESGVEVAEYVNVPEVGVYPFIDERPSSSNHKPSTSAAAAVAAATASSCCNTLKKQQHFRKDCSGAAGPNSERPNSVMDSLLLNLSGVTEDPSGSSSSIGCCKGRQFEFRPPPNVVTQVYRAQTEHLVPSSSALFGRRRHFNNPAMDLDKIRPEVAQVSSSTSQPWGAPSAMDKAPSAAARAAGEKHSGRTLGGPTTTTTTTEINFTTVSSRFRSSFGNNASQFVAETSTGDFQADIDDDEDEDDADDEDDDDDDEDDDFDPKGRDFETKKRPVCAGKHDLVEEELSRAFEQISLEDDAVDGVVDADYLDHAAAGDLRNPCFRRQRRPLLVTNIPGYQQEQQQQLWPRLRPRGQDDDHIVFVDDDKRSKTKSKGRDRRLMDDASVRRIRSFSENMMDEDCLRPKKRYVQPDCQPETPTANKRPQPEGEHDRDRRRRRRRCHPKLKTSSSSSSKKRTSPGSDQGLQSAATAAATTDLDAGTTTTSSAGGHADPAESKQSPQQRRRQQLQQQRRRPRRRSSSGQGTEDSEGHRRIRKPQGFRDGDHQGDSSHHHHHGALFLQDGDQGRATERRASADLDQTTKGCYPSDWPPQQPCSAEPATAQALTPVRKDGAAIPTMVQKDTFRRTFTSATSMVFHRQTGLPLSSSPAPLRKGKHSFDYDSSISKPSDIKRALFQSQLLSSGKNKGPAESTVDDTAEEKCGQQGFVALERETDDAGNEEDEYDYDEGDEDEDDENNGSRLTLGPCRSLSGGSSTRDRTGRHRRRRRRRASAICKKILSTSAPASITTSNLLGSFEESVLNGRLEPVSTVEGFSAEIGASGSFHPKHKTVPVTVFFYSLCDSSNISSPYLGHINLGKKGYRVPPQGTIQVTLFNPLGTVVKMFVVMYNLSDMPPNSQTFLRQRTLYMPSEICGGAADDCSTQKWLRYLIHLRFASSKSGKIYLHTDIRMIIFRKSDLDTAAEFSPGKSFELRSFTRGPNNPKFSPKR